MKPKPKQKKEMCFLTWDWKEQPDLDKLDELISYFDVPVQIREIDTQSDMFAIAIFPRSTSFTDMKLQTLFFLDLRED